MKYGKSIGRRVVTFLFQFIQLLRIYFLKDLYTFCLQKIWFEWCFLKICKHLKSGVKIGIWTSFWFLYRFFFAHAAVWLSAVFHLLSAFNMMCSSTPI